MKKIIASLLIGLTLTSSVHAEAVRKPEQIDPSTSANDENGGRPTTAANDDDFKKAKPNVGKYEKSKGVKVTKMSKNFDAVIHKLPTAGKVALKLAKGYNNVAIALAVAEMLGEGVDWALDPANNAVKILDNPNSDTTCYLAQYTGFGFSSDSTKQFKTKSVACTAYNSRAGEYLPGGDVFSHAEMVGDVCRLYDTNNDYREARFQEGNKSCLAEELSLDEIAEELQRMAEAGNKTAQQVIEDTVADMAKGRELDPELEQAAKPRNPKDPAKDKDPAKEKDPTKGKDPAKEKDPEAEPKPFELPAFCEWTGICPAWLNTEKNTKETAENTNKIEKNTKEIEKTNKEIDKTTKKQLEEETSFFKDVRGFFKWFKKEPDFKKDPDLKDFDVPEGATDLQDPSRFDKNYVSVQAQCPADVVKEIPLPGRSFRLVFEMTPICDFASIYLRPVIIFLAYIYGALSIGNAFKVGVNMGKLLTAIGTWLMSNLIGRALAGAGLAIAGSYTFGLFIDYFINKALAMLNNIPMVGLIGVAGIDKAISILLTAVMIKVYLATVSQGINIVKAK